MIGSQAYAQAFAFDDTSNVPAAEQNSASPIDEVKARDPFADEANTNPDDQEQNGVVPPENLQDPFASRDSEPVRQARMSRLSLLPLNFLYQGSYIPNVISDMLNDQSVHKFVLDGTLNWTPSDNARLKARIQSEVDVQEAHSKVSDSSGISWLEYFYEQRFFDQSQVLIVGRKYLGWSSGFQWRPADLIQNGFATKNTEIKDTHQYLGIDQIGYKINEPNFNVEAVLSNKDSGFYEGNQIAVKLGFSGASGLSLMYSKNGDYSRKYGLILDRGLPWSSTLALEAVHVDVNRALMYDSNHFGRSLESLTRISRFEQVYLSLTKFIDDQRRVNLDFLYAGNGFVDTSSAARKVSPGAQSAFATQTQVDVSIFAGQYIGRYYAYAAYAGYVDRWKLQWKPSVLVNVGDHSYIGSISIMREFFNNSNFTMALSSYHGAPGTEFGSISHGVGVSVSYSVTIL